MTSYQVALRGLSARTAGQVASLWGRVEARSLGEAQFRALAAAVIARADRRAVTLADLGLAAALIRSLRRPVLPLGLEPLAWQTDQRRIAAAVGKVLDTEVDVADEAELAASRRARLGRLAGNEPLVTAAGATSVAMVRRRERGEPLSGWVRLLGAKPCPICQSWASGDPVFPPWAQMARHVGCSCVQQVVVGR